jgi:DNA polymerase-3 subunit delta
VATPASVHRQIASGSLDSVYLVLGDDEHEKSELASEFEGAVDEGLRAFNVERFRGGDSSVGTILDAARTLPMMAPRRLVIVLRADRGLEPKRDSAAATREADALVAFVDDPPEHTTLVLVADKVDERRRVTKRLLSKATVVRCGVLETVEDAQRWIRARMTAEQGQMSADAVRSLSQRVGPDIVRLRDSLERLMLFADGREISPEDVIDVVGPAVAHDDWAVTREIERGAAAPALRELGVTLESGAVPHMVLGQLAWVARSRLPAARVPSAIDAVFRTDRALKQSGGEPRVLLERLVVELCGGGTGDRRDSRRARRR